MKLLSTIIITCNFMIKNFKNVPSHTRINTLVKKLCDLAKGIALQYIY
ncbi:hypothetical protein H1P_6530002 [Hyella patelloides LEGE 07179]|uniref:Transposase n=1 Tax=Hyella patelloides LEGE 07179 TaxID=945734 RepID=A0A563W2I0_9CYAN|nr:hypothetical protein H1P_6530002 [Hyella patelloides LEGE 07179]